MIVSSLAWPGNRTSVAELSGRMVVYGYDDLYRLTSETISNDPGEQNGAIGYVYDKVGNRKQMSSTVPAVPPGLFNYDANDRLTTDNYDANGNTISLAGIENQYDFENRLIRHGYMTIVYDGDGNRVAETVGGVTTNYLVDTQNPTGYAQVVEELQGGAVVRSYSWGHWLLAETQLLNNAWTTSFYGYDGHGLVRYLTDSAGAVTDTYDYDAFGNLISSTGTTPNNYLFAGEQYDPLGLYYNRARYLNTATGRFWNMDSYEGDSQSPLSLHKYLYASANPTNRTDPTGQFDISLPAALATAAAIVSLAAITYFHYFPISERFGFVWSGDIDWSAQLCQPGGATPTCSFSSSQIQEIKDQAVASFKLAFAPYLVTVQEGGMGWHAAVVVNWRYIENGVEADGSTPGGSMGKVSHIHYPSVLDDAKTFVGSTGLEELALGVGRGIGNVAAHELGHRPRLLSRTAAPAYLYFPLCQFLGFGSLSQIHGNVGDTFYEHNGATAPFFQQDQLRWTEQSQGELKSKLGAKQ